MEQFKNVSTVVKDCLKDNGVLITDERAKQAFQALEYIFHECESKKPSKKLKYRAWREYKVVQSIKRLILQRIDIVSRRTDKSKVFYIGRAADFERQSTGIHVKN